MGSMWWEQGRDSMYCAITFFGSLSEIAAVPFEKQASYSKVLERLRKKRKRRHVRESPLLTACPLFPMTSTPPPPQHVDMRFLHVGNTPRQFSGWALFLPTSRGVWPLKGKIPRLNPPHSHSPSLYTISY